MAGHDLPKQPVTVGRNTHDDTRIITKAALAGLDEVFRVGFKFSKAEVLLVDLRQRGEFTDDMFAQVQPETSERVMGVMDKINAKWGR